MLDKCCMSQGHVEITYSKVIRMQLTDTRIKNLLHSQERYDSLPGQEFMTVIDFRDHLIEHPS